MELESQIISSNINVFPETVFYDIFTQKNYSITHYKTPEHDKMKSSVGKSDISSKSLEPVNGNVTHIVKFPLNVMPPPPHKLVNYSSNNNNNNNNNHVIKRYHPRDTAQPRDGYRPISPKDYDSDESCNTYSSLESPDNDFPYNLRQQRELVESSSSNYVYYSTVNSLRQKWKKLPTDLKRGLNYSGPRCGMYRLSEQTIVFGKYSQSSPNIYSNVHYSHTPATHNNGHYKNRYYTNNNNHNGANNNTANASNGRQNKNNYNYNKNGMDIMVRRAHGLVERFKSRSDLMKIDPNPPGLLTGGQWDQLNRAIWDVFSSKAQKETTYENKINIWKNVFLYIRKCLNSYGLFMVGSTMSGFGLETSDLDMCLLTKPFTNDPRLDSLHHLNAIRHLLVKHDLTSESELILAKVPILKFKDKESGFEIDLNCNNAVGIRNTHLLHSYARLDWRVRPLVVMIKLWAQANSINDAKNMTVSSYSWALMVIHFLQCGVSPSVLPCLHGLAPEKFSDTENQSMDVQEEIQSVKDFKSDNTMSIGELLLGFFEYYSLFNYNEFAVSVRAGTKLTIDECRFVKAPKNDPHQWKYLCIEEPFDHTNTARSVFDLETFKHIRNLIIFSFQELARTKVLSNILPVKLDQPES